MASVSTSYYAAKPTPDPCPHCERPYVDDRYKIAYSAMGWRMLFYGASWASIKSKLLEEGREIIDEYGNTKTLVWFERFVQSNQDGQSHLGYISYHADDEGYECLSS